MDDDSSFYRVVLRINPPVEPRHMFPTKSFLFAACLLPASLLDAQLLTNPGFESGVDGWTIKEKTSISSAMAEAAHEGAAGLRISDESVDGGANVTSERFDVAPGQKIALEFMARSLNSTIASVSILPYGSNNQPLLDEQGRSPANVIIRQSTDWAHYALEWIVPEDVSAFAISIRSWSTPTGTVDLDDFTLKVE